MTKLIYVWRAALCEMFVGWAIRVAPDGYVPSYVQANLDFYDRGVRDARATEKVT